MKNAVYGPGMLWCLVLCIALHFCSPASAESGFRNYLFPDSIVLAFGDSITYGTGVSPENSYPSVLAEITGMTIINAGIPGETIAEGLARLPRVVEEYSPQLVLLCEGGNDILQGREEDEIERDLGEMVAFLQDRFIDVVVIGVPALNLSARVPGFYKDVAKDLNVPYDVKIMRKVLSDSSLKSDYIHPNEEGYRIIAERIAAVIDRNR